MKWSGLGFHIQQLQAPNPSIPKEFVADRRLLDNFDRGDSRWCRSVMFGARKISQRARTNSDSFFLSALRDLAVMPSIICNSSSLGSDCCPLMSSFGMALLMALRKSWRPGRK